MHILIKHVHVSAFMAELRVGFREILTEIVTL